MGENEVITDLSDIRLLVFNLSDEHEVTNEAVKQLLFCIDSKFGIDTDISLIAVFISVFIVSIIFCIEEKESYLEFISSIKFENELFKELKVLFCTSIALLRFTINVFVPLISSLERMFVRFS